MPKKYFSLVLHSHLPYLLNHGNWPHGEVWLLEAACETYLPLLAVLEELEEQNIKNVFTISFSPVLLEQLAAPQFELSLKKYLAQRITSAKEDYIYYQKQNEINKSKTALFWKNFYTHSLEIFLRYNENIVEGFKYYYNNEFIEIITSATTHGYLPLLLKDESILLQLQLAQDIFYKHFEKTSAGLWLPECAYRPSGLWKNPASGETIFRKGIEKFIEKANFKYFFVDTSLFKDKTLSPYSEKITELNLQNTTLENIETNVSIYNPYYVLSNGNETSVCVFARDDKTGVQVWSRDLGYPGDYNYLEFHKRNFPSGHRYWKISGQQTDLGDKEEYYTENAFNKTKEHAKHFVSVLEGLILNGDNLKIENTANYELSRPSFAVCPNSQLPIIITSPFDTELFGHWWFEGPKFLSEVMKNTSQSKIVQTITPSKYLKQFPAKQCISLPEGSWGEGGKHYVWYNEETAYTWEKIYECENKIWEAVEKNIVEDKELLKQLLIELLMLQSSDWQFLITTQDAKDYAKERFNFHYQACSDLLNAINKKDKLQINLLLNELKNKDFIFKEVEASLKKFFQTSKVL